MTNYKDVLLEVVDQIMTDMFFIFPDMGDEGEQLTDGSVSDEHLSVRIHFHTDEELHFDIDKALLREMASNFMGLAPDAVDEEHMKSMAQEAANIIGGNLLVKIDPENKYKLSIPEFTDITMNQDNVSWSMNFIADGNVMSIMPVERNES
jgi:CheY-specific phosphatase CheX